MRSMATRDRRRARLIRGGFDYDAAVPEPDDSIPALSTLHRGARLQIGAMKSPTLLAVDLPVKHLPADLRGMKILHVGDTHFHTRWESGFDRAIELINAQTPDLICHSGDWVDNKFDYTEGLENVKRFASQVRSRLGVWSSIGNHDGDLLAPALMDMGIKVLIGEVARFSGASGTLEIVGLPGVARDDLTDAVIESIAPPGEQTFRITLSHFPDSVRKCGPLGSDLFLAGHTHGGQCCLPGSRPIITHDSLGSPYHAGLHRLENTWLHITRGLGWTGLPLRVFCGAEMTLIRLVGPTEDDAKR
jgi:uncharacterized protein